MKKVFNHDQLSIQLSEKANSIETVKTDPREQRITSYCTVCHVFLSSHIGEGVTSYKEFAKLDAVEHFSMVYDYRDKYWLNG